MKENKLDKFFLTDKAFFVLMALLSGGVILATSIYINFGIGALNELFVVQSLDKGLTTGDFAEATAFGFAYLFARILEGPLVGILDIGGAIMTGVGVGIPALLLAAGIDFWTKSYLLSFILGAIIGCALAAIIIGVRKMKPSNTVNLGTDIMIGAGNATGKWLGPLIVIYAAIFNPITGIGSALGGALFYKYDRPVTGGAIIGAMLFGGITLMIIG
ncbi:MAG: DUF4310 family protein [Mycoplasmatales bacterium]